MRTSYVSSPSKVFQTQIGLINKWINKTCSDTGPCRRIAVIIDGIVMEGGREHEILVVQLEVALLSLENSY